MRQRVRARLSQQLQRTPAGTPHARSLRVAAAPIGMLATCLACILLLLVPNIPAASGELHVEEHVARVPHG